MRPRPFFRFRLLPALLAACFALPLAMAPAAPPAFANSYKRGHYSCSDFQRAEKHYQLKPSGGTAVAYALCLLTRGGEDVRALNILDSEIAKGHVSAAWDKAFYIATGGTFISNELDERNYNEAYQAYAKVLLLINLKPDYPKGFIITEKEEQHELGAYFYLIYISYFKFLAGLNGAENALLLQSPTYKGDRNLKLYSKYQPYTIDSSEKTIEHAGRCASLPRKFYFKSLLYKKTMIYCRVMKEYAIQLLPLEKERLTILNNKACTRDIKTCSEYQNLIQNIIDPFVTKKEKEANDAWRITN